MVNCDVETLLHTLTYGHARHHDYELRPPELFVHFEHRLDIDVGLSRTGLHLHVQLAVPEFLDEVVGLPDVFRCLDPVDILQKFFFGENDICIFISRVLFIVRKLQLACLPGDISAASIHLVL